MSKPSPSRDDDRQIFDRALAELEATATNFATICIRDARVRQQYVLDIKAMSQEFLDRVASSRMSPKTAAEQVNRLRNQIMDLARLRSSPVGRAYATRLKPAGRTLADVAERYAARMFGRGFASLSESEQAAVYSEIIAASGRADQSVVELANVLGRVGRRVYLVSLAVAAYEIYSAEDKPREIVRQGVLASAGIAGGWAVGAGAVAVGACAATAPVCVGLAALAGGILFAFGADLTFSTVYPAPSRRYRRDSVLKP